MAISPAYNTDREDGGPACAGLTDLFDLTFPMEHPLFPDQWILPKAVHVEAAVEVCRGCPVRRECLREALESGVEYGVWGATTPGQRDALSAAARQLPSRPVAA